MVPTYSLISSADQASPLAKRLILLGVGGGIAAYKSCELARLLVRAGADVHVLMTHAATELVQPLTFAALTQNPVGTTLFDPDSPTAMSHTELGMKADAVVIAPATADLVGRISCGLANDIVTTTMLVAECPTLICPAMNTNMWNNPQVQENIARLQRRPEYRIMEPDDGELACGISGPGRLPEPQAIVDALCTLFAPRIMEGRRVLISGGPTREYIDPVRFLSNPSTGTMAISMANAALSMGAEVTLVLGPTHASPRAGVNCIRVVSAEEMSEAIHHHILDADLLCMAAAVSDWKPSKRKDKKEHKSGSKKSLDLVRTQDILQTIGQSSQYEALVLGFAAETEENWESLVDLGREKMKKKGCDFLFVNPVDGERLGFGPGQTSGVLLGPGKETTRLGPLKKENLGTTLMETIAGHLPTPRAHVKEAK